MDITDEDRLRLITRAFEIQGDVRPVREINWVKEQSKYCFLLDIMNFEENIIKKLISKFGGIPTWGAFFLTGTEPNVLEFARILIDDWEISGVRILFLNDKPRYEISACVSGQMVQTPVTSLEVERPPQVAWTKSAKEAA